MVVSYIGLWKILLEKGLQKQDLVEHAGLSSATVAKWEEESRYLIKS